MKIDLYEDGIGYVTDEVSTIPADESNLNMENRIKFVTDVAAISRGKDKSNNPELRFKQLLTEGAYNTPSRPLEFLPVKILEDRYGDMYSTDEKEIYTKNTWDSFHNNILKFSYIDGNETFTNARTILKLLRNIEQVPFNTKEELKDFKIIKLKVPMFVWSQFMTHTQLSKESQSDRVSTENEYWLPKDLVERCKNFTEPSPEFILTYSKCRISSITMVINQIASKQLCRNEIVNLLINDVLNQTQVQLMFKMLGYKKEIYQRAPYYFKYKVFIMSGWKNDPFAWDNLLAERGAKDDWKNWVQEQTKEATLAISKIINN